MQMQLPVDGEGFNRSFPPKPKQASPDELAIAEQRLQAELLKVRQLEERYERVRRRARDKIRLQREHAAALIAQIESLQRNPYAIERYDSAIEGWDQSDAWYNQPLAVLRLDTVSAFGEKRTRLLTNLCPTVGDLDLERVYVGLTNITGINKPLAERIERRLIKWLRSHAAGYQIRPSYEDWHKAEKRDHPDEIRLTS